MSRYNFTLTNNYECCFYMESTPEEDKLDIGIMILGGNGYLKFWKRCREATDNSGLFGTATILDTYFGEEKTWEIDPPKVEFTIIYTAKDIMDASHGIMTINEINKAAIHINQQFYEHMAEWVTEKCNEMMEGELA